MKCPWKLSGKNMDIKVKPLLKKKKKSKAIIAINRNVSYVNAQKQ